jgi:hypothetical protein
MNYELGKRQKEAVVAFLINYSRSYLEVMRKITRTVMRAVSI